ncbi:hypothetical protein DNTS_026904 [Danionella cerebrum]|uniref:BESS domain-containing protein n=1 Tax=Danionella cerebrum TaxID=2873325 RepID=A0A553QE58_9TELE|nr:hypothetical protein DNTS_026904 [Danionella translucida]
MNLPASEEIEVVLEDTQTQGSDAEEVAISDSSPSSITSASALLPTSSVSCTPAPKENVKKRKRLDSPEFLEKYLESRLNYREERQREREMRRKEKEEHRQQKELKRIKEETEEQQKDDSYMFFVSMLPLLRSLPAAQKSLIKFKIHHMLYEAAYGQAPSVPPGQLSAMLPVFVKEETL